MAPSRNALTQPRRSDGRAGFTLTELMVVMAVGTVVAAVGYNAMSGLNDRAKSRNSLQEITVALQVAKGEAFGRGQSVVFRLGRHPSAVAANASAPYVYQVILDGGAETTNFATSEAIGTGDSILTWGTLSTDVDRAPATSPSLSKTITGPLGVIPANSPCTFCTTSDVYAVVRFRSDGQARLGNVPGNYPVGGSFSLSRTKKTTSVGPPPVTTATEVETITYLISTRTAMVRALTRTDL